VNTLAGAARRRTDDVSLQRHTVTTRQHWLCDQPGHARSQVLRRMERLPLIASPRLPGGQLQDRIDVRPITQRHRDLRFGDQTLGQSVGRDAPEMPTVHVLVR